MTEIQYKRNFSIVAHIDHGKSTLADRMIEICGGLSDREMKDQVLDSMDIERERGITIKAQTVKLKYQSRNGNKYELNLIDTPGHVDFTYEVSRSLEACEGSLLVVDSTQGVEAQTLANAYLAIEADHELIPVLNKIDLPASDPDRVSNQIEEVVGVDATDALKISAKTGDGVAQVLEKIIDLVPPPTGSERSPLKALLVDSWYDPYLGVMILVRVKDGYLSKGMKIRFMSSDSSYQIDNVGVFTPKPTPVERLTPGDVGYITASIKTVAETPVGDTITSDKNPADAPLPGFKPSIPVVFSSLFPTDNAEFDELSDSLAKLRLNDSSFVFDAESSVASGLCFRFRFLGL